MPERYGYCALTVYPKDYSTFWGEAARVSTEVLNFFGNGCKMVIVAVEFAPLNTDSEIALTDTIDAQDAIIAWARELSGSDNIIAKTELVTRNQTVVGKIIFTKRPGY